MRLHKFPVEPLDSSSPNRRMKDHFWVSSGLGSKGFIKPIIPIDLNNNILVILINLCTNNGMICLKVLFRYSVGSASLFKKVFLYVLNLTTSYIYLLYLVLYIFDILNTTRTRTTSLKIQNPLVVEFRKGTPFVGAPFEFFTGQYNLGFPFFIKVLHP
jgi:hypothetical protein